MRDLKINIKEEASHVPHNSQHDFSEIFVHQGNNLLCKKINSYWNHRIRSREHQQYGLVFEIMGPIPRPRSTIRSLLQYDPCQQHWAWRSYGYCWDYGRLLGIRIHDPGCSNAYGRNGVLSSCTAFTLVNNTKYIYIGLSSKISSIKQMDTYSSRSPT